MNNDTNELTLGTRSHFSTRVVLYHKDKDMDATDVVRHLQILKVQDPTVSFTLNNPNIAEFLEDYHLIKSSENGGYLVDHGQADNREKILDIICEHIDRVIKKCNETYPNGKLVITE